jgi:hypothetical protein
MLTDDLIAAIDEHPLIKPALNEIILLTMQKLDLEGELLARGYVDAINDVKQKSLGETKHWGDK